MLGFAQSAHPNLRDLPSMALDPGQKPPSMAKSSVAGMTAIFRWSFRGGLRHRRPNPESAFDTSSNHQSWIPGSARGAGGPGMTSKSPTAPGRALYLEARNAARRPSRYDVRTP